MRIKGPRASGRHFHSQQLNPPLSIPAAATAQTSPQSNSATVQAVLPSSPRPAPGSRGPLASSTRAQSAAFPPVMPTPYIGSYFS
ncbi:hypothetical protein PILCRDRAFT_9731 [Piloderma croceum F 1598]|uniref:Uncharacterized protein n=1 Tax=Piloderma croceum (strain F 1598) TaxID=765440 RepID=A0A0C3FJW1_PILCF|nr:hypothetical protein PILCRDRAFT_9731 [Piloderma croceum F 1598]